MNSTRQATTDAAGRFEFTDLPEGRFTVAASKPGYVTAIYGAPGRGSLGLTIALRAGQPTGDVTIALARGGVISGRLLDQTGAPAAGVSVSAIIRQLLPGAVRQLRAGMATTDERGEYRIYGLGAGSYIVAASIPEVRVPGGMSSVTQPGTPSTPVANRSSAPQTHPSVQYSAVLYPGTNLPAGAALVTIESGQERSKVDFVLRPFATTEVLGRVTRINAQTVRNVQISVIASDENLSLATGDPRLRSIVSADGRFSLRLPPGGYTILARGANADVTPSTGTDAANLMDLWAASTIAVDRDTFIGLQTLELRTGATLAGRMVFDASNGRQTPDPKVLSLRIARGRDSNVDYALPPIHPAADGTFTFRGIPTGSYTLESSAGGLAGVPRWMLKSAIVGNRDVLDSGLDVKGDESIRDVVLTVTDAPTELTGTVFDQSGRPSYTRFVAMFPVDSQYWKWGSRRIRSPTRPASDGSFKFTGLPAGDYYLVALSSVDPDTWVAPGFLQGLVPSALRIRLADGEKKTQDVHLAR